MRDSRRLLQDPPAGISGAPLTTTSCSGTLSSSGNKKKTLAFFYGKTYVSCLDSNHLSFSVFNGNYSPDDTPRDGVEQNLQNQWSPIYVSLSLSTKPLLSCWI